ncbi:hypothetical protein DPMN_040030 [Dreissena polymorpha]|uniref:Uncharacterized protein n=1 Tax=Dreissena polymorpha TaxID=45954 RepID=A0A9D4HUU2_DREPO|nr:hypothetical protein DPMN_040030 [Dreissena polymorpha]
MLEDGSRVILRLKRIRKAIVASPEPMMWFSKRRIELEMLLMECVNISDENGEVDYSFIIVNAMKSRLKDILRELEQRILLEGSSVNDIPDIFERLLM